MAVGIIIHVTVGSERRTELFTDERIRIGADEVSDLQIHSPKFGEPGLLLEIEYQENSYRIIKFNEKLKFIVNGKPIRRYIAIADGDVIEISETGISFSFFSLNSKSSLITTRQDTPQVAQFIEQAAIGAAISPKRDDAKMFLREFVRELSREISWTTKLIVLVLAVGFISGILYLGYAFNNELAQNRQQSEQQSQTIRQLQEQLVQNNEQIGELDKSTKTAIDIVSLAPSLKTNYYSGICLIVGVYDLVDRTSGKTLRYPDPQAFQPDPYEPSPPAMEDQIPDVSNSETGLTTEGNGTPVEYDFLGTGFYVGGGYIVTNRHVLQPWEEDDLVKQMMKESGGRARIKRLNIYFPNIPQPFTMKIRQLDYREDLAVGTFDPSALPLNIPVLPLEAESNAAAVGRTVVSMGYPNGPDRLLAMADDDEARSLNARCAGSRQCIINSLAQLKKIVPLTTQGSITDMDTRRIVHDAKTAEGGSGAPIFGQNAKVIGVNFGVFTGNNATNLAVPIRFAIDLLKKAGWKSPEEIQQNNQSNSAAAMNSNTKPLAIN